MAKKALRTKPDKKPPKRKKAAPAQDPGKGATSSIPQDTVDRIWSLYSEGKSKREIGRLLGVSENTVRRKLSEDPERRVAVERSAAEERGKLYEEIENRGTKLVLNVLESLEGILRTPAGKARRKFNSEDLAYLDRAPRLITALGGLSDKATKNAGGLAGASRGPDGDVKTPVTEDAKGDWTAEDLIQTAVTMEVTHKLPPWLREIAERMRKAGMLEKQEETNEHGMGKA